MPVSPAMTPDAEPASEPINSILRNAARLSGCVTDDHHPDSMHNCVIQVPWLHVLQLADCPGSLQLAERDVAFMVAGSLAACFPVSACDSSASCSWSVWLAPHNSSGPSMTHTHCASDVRLPVLLHRLLLLLLLQVLCTVRPWGTSAPAASCTTRGVGLYADAGELS